MSTDKKVLVFTATFNELDNIKELVSTIKKQPSFNNQMKVLPKILVQNASLEISKTGVLKFKKLKTGI